MATHYVINLRDEAQVKELAQMAIGKQLWGGRLYKAVKFKSGNDSWWGFGFEGSILNYLRMKVPEYRKQLTDDIVETAKNIYLGIREANDVTVRMDTVFQMEDYMERNRLQRKALRDCKRLLYLIDLAHRRFHLTSKRVKYWGKLVKNIKDRVHGWIDDDTERYKPRD